MGRQSTTNSLRVPVLICGGGPVGLTAFLCLSHAGVTPLLVERHPGTAIHPKARGLNARTMEIFRTMGLEGAVSDAGLPPGDHGYFFRGPTLAASEFERTGGGGLAGAVEALSPSTWMVVSQDALEPVLLDAVRRHDADAARFGWVLEQFEERPDGILADVVERASGRVMRVHSDYLIGADGAQSQVRDGAGIGMRGHGPLVHNVSILFEADLRDVVADRQSAVYYLAAERDVRPRGYPMSVGNPPPDGVLLTVNGTDRWLLVVAASDPSAADGGLDTDHARSLVRNAIGREDVAVRVMSLMAWTPAARVAEHYGTSRTFLAGDAAHEMTPSGAFGLNTGIQDAHNLAWKLADVLHGDADPSLLATYDTERRPVGTFTAETSYELFAGTRAPRPFGNWGVIFGAVYDSAAVVPDSTPLPVPADPVVDYQPMAKPGHRAPHAWLTLPDGRRASTIDLFGSGFVLVAAAASWADAARDCRPSVRCVVIGVDATPGDATTFTERYGIGEHGAVLVRPDGYVAWRSSDGPASRETLETALARVLGRAQ